jgi:nicotinamide-nucleotide amidase
MRRAWVISTGTELTLGQTVDTNSAWIAQRLAALGVRTERHVTVADELRAICDVLREATRHADLVVLSGGLGPTDDDLTRQAFADVSGRPLTLHAASLEQVRAFFSERGREMPEPNRVQALLPESAEAIRNQTGTAPGIAMQIGGALCIALPGVPSELMQMFESDVAPRVAADAGGRVLLSRKLNCTGRGESEIGALIRDLMQRGRNPEVGTTAASGIIGVRLNAEADSSEQAQRLLDETEADVRRRLGDLIFGHDDETLAEAVGRLLRQARRTVSTAESCTGGLIGKLLTDIAGSSDYFVGSAVTYSNQAKQRLLNVPADVIAGHGAVSAETASAMAAGARAVLASDYAISATGIAGPSGGSAAKPVGLVFIGLATPKTVRAHELQLGATSGRVMVRLRAAQAALNLLRLELLGSRRR